MAIGKVCRSDGKCAKVSLELICCFRELKADLSWQTRTVESLLAGQPSGYQILYVFYRVSDAGVEC